MTMKQKLERKQNIYNKIDLRINPKLKGLARREGIWGIGGAAIIDQISEDLKCPILRLMPHLRVVYFVQGTFLPL